MCNPDNLIDDRSTTSGNKGPEEHIEEKIDCPLFMDGLPNDFQSNPQLAAIASLLDNEETSTKEEEEEEKTLQDVHINPRPLSKARDSEARSKSRSLRRITMSSPYLPPTKKPSTSKTASMGEAQLFLKMWKLS